MGFLTALIGPLVGSLFGGGKKQAAPPAPVANVVDLAATEDDDNALISLVEGLLGGGGMAAQRAPTTGFSVSQALAGGDQGRMTQRSNQIGGQSSPGFAGQGLFRDRNLGPGRGGGGGGGEGRGAGGSGNGPGGNNFQQLWQQWQGWQQPGPGQPQAPAPAPQPQALSSDLDWQGLLSRLWASGGQYTAPLQQPYTSYMGQALAGQAGLPQEAYQQALLRGQSTINAQAQRSREGLAGNLGSRGLLSSGLMARGLRGVEEAKLGATGDLIGGLNQQDMQARIEAQRAAAGQMPGLIGAQSGAMGDIVRSWLAMRQLQLEAGRLGLLREQQGDSFWSSIGGIFGNLAGDIFGGGSSGGGGTPIGSTVTFLPPYQTSSGGTP